MYVLINKILSYQKLIVIYIKFYWVRRMQISMYDLYIWLWRTKLKEVGSWWLCAKYFTLLCVLWQIMMFLMNLGMWCLTMCWDENFNLAPPFTCINRFLLLTFGIFFSLPPTCSSIVPSTSTIKISFPIILGTSAFLPNIKSKDLR